MSRRIVAATGLVWLVLMSALLCPGASAQQGSGNQTPWSSQSHIWGSGASALKVGRTYPMRFRIQPTASGTQPQPPVAAVVASGRCHVSRVSIKPWKPGKSNILQVTFDYKPLERPKAQPHVVHLRTRNRQVAAVIRLSTM
jgi:hypothetical protein